MLGPTIHGTRISLQPARPTDGPLRQEWFSNLEVTRFFTSPGVPSLVQEQESFERAARDHSVVLWRISLEGETIGQTFLHNVDWVSRTGFTGMWIGDPRHWGSGHGSEAVRLRTAFAFEELGLERIETATMDLNVGMHRALERSGFRRIGVRSRYLSVGGTWHDEYIFELLQADWRGLQ